MKSAAWLFSGTMIGRALRAFILIYSARVLGADSWGAFSLGLSLSAVFTILSDMGVNAVLVKEGVKSDDARRRHFASAFLIKFPVLAVFAAAASLIILIYSLRIPGIMPLLPFIILIFTFDSLRDLVSSLARSFERMDLDAKGQIFTNAAIVAVSLIALRFSPSALSVIASYAAGTLLGLLFVSIPLRREFAGLLSRWNWRLVKEMVTSAWPFGLVSLMGVVAVNTDALIVGLMRDAVSVGLYSAALRPIQFLYVIPAALASAIFPSLARLSDEKSEFRRLLSSGIRSAYLFALPLAIGGFITARGAINLLYGPEYLSGAPSFAILSLTFLFVFPSLFITNALFARNLKGKTFLVYSAIGIFGNAALDVVFINIWGIAGSAFATLIIQGILFFYGSRKLRDDLDFSVFSGASKIFVSSAAMGLVAAILTLSGAHVLITIAISGAVYLLSLIALREPTLKEISRPLLRKIGLSPEWQGEQ